MRLLTVPNWSFGRDVGLSRLFAETLEFRPLRVHYLKSDVDHNRTVTAFSGHPDVVFETVLTLAEFAFDRIDLNRHVGVHPRIGALDVCPFVVLPGWDEPPETERLLSEIEAFGDTLAHRYHLPVFLYEKSERGRHEADLPSLRKGGFGGLLDRDLRPDFGPSRAHPRLGITVVGLRDFLIALNVNLLGADARVAQQIAREIRTARSEGDLRFVGVRALGFYLASAEVAQVSMNLTLPDLTAVDAIVEWVGKRAFELGTRAVGNELIGVIRSRDLPNAESLEINPHQIVDGAFGDAPV
ncbi:MAG: glutamate formiminotransferase [Chthonomonas sp.]|nr:hypothetical protein [Fimbriimonadaceae bacterium]